MKKGSEPKPAKDVNEVTKAKGAGNYDAAVKTYANYKLSGSKGGKQTTAK